jgi:hypothetical protein
MPPVGGMVIGRFLEDYLRDHGDNFLDLFAYLSGHIVSTQKSIWCEIIADTNRTILMSSAKFNCYQISREILFLYPECMNIVNSEGLSALHYAAFHGHLALVQLLQQHGAHSHLKNKYSEYPFDSASLSGHSDLEYVILSQFLFGYRPFENQAQPQASVAKIFDPSSAIERSRRNLEWIEDFNFKQWSASLPFPLLLDDYLLNSSTSRTGHVPRPQSAAALMPPPTLVTNSFAELSFLQKYSIVVRQNLSGGTEMIGKEFDPFPVPADSAQPRPTAITIGRSQSNTIVLSDLSISKSHCEITHFEGIGLCLKDCQSRHGTSVDGLSVTARSQQSALSQRSSARAPTNMIVIQDPAVTITVGRVILGFLLKPIVKTVAKRFVGPSLDPHLPALTSSR